MLVTRPLIGCFTDQFGAKLVIMVASLLSLLVSIPFIFINGGTSII